MQGAASNVVALESAQAATMQAQAEYAVPTDSVAAPNPAALPRGGLFTAAPATSPPPATSAPGVYRPSIFRTVTSALRRAPSAPGPTRAEPHMEQEDERTALVRPATVEPDAGGLDIPAFLRRQSS
jgi:hypothetical protein